MKNTFKKVLLLSLIFIVTGCALINFYSLNDTDLISPLIIKTDLFFLASDSLKGRSTPSEGLEIAADYIANKFKSYGLKSFGESYFQKFGLVITNLGSENFLNITKSGELNEFKIKEDFIPFEMTANDEVSGKLVFVGYGIRAKEYNYNDYHNIDVKGKIVLVLRHEPGEEDSSSIFDGVKATDYSNVSTKVKIAIEEGAIGVLVVTDPLNHSNLSPRGFPWPSLSRTIPVDALPMTLNLAEPKVPVVHVGEDIIELLFGSVDSLKKIQTAIDSSLQPRSFEFDGVFVNLRTSTVVTEKFAKNVLGYIEGSDDKLKEEIIVVGAHYDHIGLKRNVEPGADSIFNGADDNASGTSGLLAIARAFSEMNSKPKRTILFIAFAGEEKGLLGSKYYVTYPLFPLEKTVAMINLDMIGRNAEDSVILIGSQEFPSLWKIVVEENQKVGLNLVESDQNNFGGSDHVSFYRKNIPVLFFFTGIHNDYHNVTDHAELININKIAKISRLALRTVWKIANEGKYYKKNNGKNN